MSARGLRPSGAGQWVACPGSVRAQRDLPNTTSLYATEGTDTHTLGADLIDLACRSIVYENAGGVKGLPKAQNLNADQIQGAYDYAKNTFAVLQYYRIFGGPNMGIESRIDMSSIYPGYFGTTDFWVYSSNENSLFLSDLKYGFGIIEPFENYQLISYAAGIIDRLQLTNDTKVNLRIYQPRAYHYRGPSRTWVTTVRDLQPYIRKLQQSANEAMSDYPRYVPGAHCRYCRARGGCDALRQEAASLFDCCYHDGHYSTNLNDAGVELAILEHVEKLVSYRLTSLRELVKTVMVSGRQVPGYKLVSEKSALKWEAPAENIAELGDAYGIELRKPSVITPTQAKAAGLPKPIVDMYAKRGANKTKLSADDGSEARMVFGGKKND